jgi:hypothetical protein
MTAADIDGLLPLWSVGVTPERAAALVQTMTDPQTFWRPSGVPTGGQGAEARVYPYVMTVLGEGLLEYGYTPEATELVKRLLAAQAATLKMSRTFAAYYDADQPRGYNANGDIAGLPPLHLLLRVLGVRIISPTRVWTGGRFAWGSPVKVTQRGVLVQRSDSGTQVHFPSGRLVTLPPDAPWQEITDAPTDTFGNQNGGRGR